MKIVFKWIDNVILFILILIFIVSFINFKNNKKDITYIPKMGSYIIMTVLSGSMSPTFNTNDIIIDKKININKLKKGDVITFWDDRNTIVTHRVIDIKYQDGKRLFMTKGDANNIEDQKLVEESKVEGIYKFRIPYGNLILSNIRSFWGFVIFSMLVIFDIMSDYLNKEKKVQI